MKVYLIEVTQANRGSYENYWSITFVNKVFCSKDKAVAYAMSIKKFGDYLGYPDDNGEPFVIEWDLKSHDIKDESNPPQPVIWYKAHVKGGTQEVDSMVITVLEKDLI